MKRKLKGKLLFLFLLPLIICWPIKSIRSEEPSVTFTWTNETDKEAKVENTYLTINLDGNKGFNPTEITLNSRPFAAISRGVRPYVEGSPVPELFVGQGMPEDVPLEDTSISVEQISSTLLRITAKTIFKNVNWTFVYLFTDAPYFTMHFVITFLTDLEFTRLDYEFECDHGGGQKVAWVDNTGQLQTLEILGEEPTWHELGGPDAGWPLGEPWIAWWDPDTELAMGQIFLTPSNLKAFYLNDESADGHTTWYTAMTPNEVMTPVTVGTKFEDTSIYWFGEGDYTAVRNLAKNTGWSIFQDLTNKFSNYAGSFNITEIQQQVTELQDQVDNLNVQLNQAIASATTQMYTGLAGGLGGGIVIGAIVGWFLKKPKKPQ